jgi:hypothetical protein
MCNWKSWILGIFLATSLSSAQNPDTNHIKNEMATGVVRTQADVNRDRLSIKDFGADPTGVVDSTAAIQAAFNKVCTLGGGRINGPSGTYKISATLTMPCGGVILDGSGSGFGKPAGVYPVVTSQFTLKAALGFAGPMYRIDPADIGNGLGQFTRGSSISNVTFDLSLAPTILAIYIGTLSNAPIFENVSVIGGTSTALEIGSSINGISSISEGLQFENFIMYAPDNVIFSKTNPVIYIHGANEILFHGGKLLAGYAPDNNIDTIGVIVEEGFPFHPTEGITFDGMSFTFWNDVIVRTAHSSVQYYPRQIRFLNCTFERYNVAITVTSLTTATPEFIQVGPNRLSGGVGANQVGILFDKVSASSVTQIAPEIYSTDANPAGLAIKLNSGATYNNIIAAQNSQILDNGIRTAILSYDFEAALNYKPYWYVNYDLKVNDTTTTTHLNVTDGAYVQGGTNLITGSRFTKVSGTGSITQSLVSSTPTYGSELITDGGFTTPASWTVGAGSSWSVAGGYAHNVGGGVYYGTLYQVVTAPSAAAFKIVFTIANYTSGCVHLTNGLVATPPRCALGTYTEVLQTTGANTTFSIQEWPSFVGDVDNLSIMAITGETMTASGLTLTALPTSCAGLATGTLWNNSNVINVCP